MYSVEPNVLLQMIKQGKNPQQLMMSILQGQAYNNPLGKNLLNLAQQGGQNFDQEFEAFKRAIGYNN